MISNADWIALTELPMKPLLALLLFAGASAASPSNSGVVPDGANAYRILLVGKTGFASSGTLQRKAYEQATAHCGTQSLVMETISMESKQSRPFGGWPEATLRFRCVAVTSVAPAKGPAPDVDDRYSQIERLKSLLDSGALTQSEYDSEKLKILGR